MRIISGTYRGRQIYPPRNFKARPTTDFAKESLFNILNNHFDFEGMDILDLFSGTGSISYEFASRGARSVFAVESSSDHFRFIRQTAGQLGFDQLKVIRGDVFSFIRRPFQSFDLIFADPPYDLPGISTLPDEIFKTNILLPGGWFILEHGSRMSFTAHPRFYQHRAYGSVNFSIFLQSEE
ncbi:MAG: RsmD family RNA methyltransferase [Bacteroidota bacterium]